MNALKAMMDEEERKKEEKRKKEEALYMGVSGKPVPQTGLSPIKKPIQSIGVRG